MENKTKGAGDDYPVILQTEKKVDGIDTDADLYARQLEGQYMPAKCGYEAGERAAKERTEKELASLKEVVKDLLPLAQEVFDSITIDDAESHREYISLKELLDRAKALLR